MAPALGRPGGLVTFLVTMTKHLTEATEGRKGNSGRVQSVMAGKHGGMSVRQLVT